MPEMKQTRHVQPRHHVNVSDTFLPEFGDAVGACVDADRVRPVGEDWARPSGPDGPKKRYMSVSKSRGTCRGG